MRRASGFTLMEALVVLVIVSLAVGTMFQMLGAYRIARERVAAQASGLGREALFRAWFTDSIHGLMPMPDAPFDGGVDGFEGMTLNPLLAAAGAPTRIAWSIEDGEDAWVVRYTEDGKERWSLPVRSTTRPRFAYYAADGREVASWPPPSGLQVALPASIALVMGERTAVASVLGPLEPRLDPFELEQE